MLVVSSEPLPIERIVEVIQEEDEQLLENEIRAAIDRLISIYAERSRPFGRGIRVEEVAGGIQLRTPPENSAFLQRLLSARPQRLTRAALETLAIIAYRQPITKPDVEAIRGVDIGAVLRALLDRELVRIVGKKEEVGRPILYATTPKFLELFGLRSLGALPSLREYHELDEDSEKQLEELNEIDDRRISALASTARFLVERTNDPGLAELDRAVASVAEADRRTRRSLGDELDGDEDSKAGEPKRAPNAEPPDPPTAVAEASPSDASTVEIAPVQADTTTSSVLPEPWLAGPLDESASEAESLGAEGLEPTASAPDSDDALARVEPPVETSIAEDVETDPPAPAVEDEPSSRPRRAGRAGGNGAREAEGQKAKRPRSSPRPRVSAAAGSDPVAPVDVEREPIRSPQSEEPPASQPDVTPSPDEDVSDEPRLPPSEGGRVRARWKPRGQVAQNLVPAAKDDGPKKKDK
ncbi:MAG: SMC-Scp complex subunit ScpB [Deltaproteobacteria bacterium]|nr:SMC-Scp complex subunit ScpB [Deltaproteobacteria bacterium]